MQALLEPYAAVSAGTFGRVLECWDRKHRSYVAIKIVRNVKKYRDAAMIEVSLPSLFDPLSAHFVCICSSLVLVWSSLALLVSLLNLVKHCKHLQQLQMLALRLQNHKSRLLICALALFFSHLHLHVILLMPYLCAHSQAAEHRKQCQLLMHIPDAVLGNSTLRPSFDNSGAVHSWRC